MTQIPPNARFSTRLGKFQALLAEETTAVPPVHQTSLLQCSAILIMRQKRLYYVNPVQSSQTRAWTLLAASSEAKIGGFRAFGKTLTRGSWTMLLDNRSRRSCSIFHAFFQPVMLLFNFFITGFSADLRMFWSLSACQTSGTRDQGRAKETLEPLQPLLECTGFTTSGSSRNTYLPSKRSVTRKFQKTSWEFGKSTSNPNRR
jgi:hypothetical protein